MERHETESQRSLAVGPRQKDQFPEFPQKMVIAVDGWLHVPKAKAGIWLAATLGGVFVDSSRFYRALVKDCQDSGVNMENSEAVAEYCRSASVYSEFVPEFGQLAVAKVGVNDRWYPLNELTDVVLPNFDTVAFFAIRERVHKSLRACECDKRIVIIGSDIGTAVFPDTIYKFFFDDSKAVVDKSELDLAKYPGAGDPNTYQHHHCVTCTWNGFKVLMMDTSRLAPIDTGSFMLMESVLRASEAGVYG